MNREQWIAAVVMAISLLAIFVSVDVMLMRGWP